MTVKSFRELNYKNPHVTSFEVLQANGLNDDKFNCLTIIGKNPYYECCPFQGCGKNLVDIDEGNLQCIKWSENVDAFELRYTFSLQICDNTECIWETCCWDMKAQKFFGISPRQLDDIHNVDEDQYSEIIKKHDSKVAASSLVMCSKLELWAERWSCLAIAAMESRTISFWSVVSATLTNSR